jgi:hypothetical protein
MLGRAREHLTNRVEPSNQLRSVYDTIGMKSLNGWVVRSLLLSGLGLGISGSGCASQQSTAQALAIAGTAAVIIGASLAADGDCTEALEVGGVGYCSSGLSRGTRQAGTAVALAGLGAAAAGYALQPRGPDRTRPALAPLAPTQPYRLIRTTPPELDPIEPELTPATRAAPEAEAAPAPNGALGAPPAGDR